MGPIDEPISEPYNKERRRGICEASVSDISNSVKFNVNHYCDYYCGCGSTHIKIVIANKYVPSGCCAIDCAHIALSEWEGETVL